MRELYEVDRLTEALRDARARTLAIYAHLEGPAWEIPYLDIVNPPLWELAHIAWFQEYWCQRHRPNGAYGPSRIENADARFNSSIVPHRDRWEIARVPRDFVFSYLAGTLEATLEALAGSPEDSRYFFELALLHEDMHGEALLMTLQTLGLPAPPIPALDPPRATLVPARDVFFEGATFLQGAPADSREFVFDNEKPGYAATVSAFAMAERPVSCGEFAEFVADQGYGREELWTPAGGQWRTDSKAEAPRYWRRVKSEWLVRRYDLWHAIDLSAPVVHVTLHEAEAYCRWAKRRLPTETEWEYAARGGGVDQRYPWGDVPAEAPAALDYRYRGPSAALADPAPSRKGLRQMLGGVWEWTATPFAPYAGFRPDPYADYSQPWFHNHQVLRGGCFATRGRLVHNRWRNFYRPERNDAFAGFRTCALSV